MTCFACHSAAHKGVVRDLRNRESQRRGRRFYAGDEQHCIFSGDTSLQLRLHILSANLLIPKFIANRVSIGPVAATVGILFWGWLWGVMGLLLAVPLTAFIKMVADLHPSLCHLSNMLALTPRPTPCWVRYSETALERAMPYLRPRGEKASAGRQP